MRLKNKSVVITGSSRGIGKIVAFDMAREGAGVVINGTTPELVDRTVSEIRESGGAAVPNYDSVVTMEGGRKIIQSALSAYGKIDVLINNAAVSRDRSIIKMTEEDWDTVIAVDLKGVFCCTKAAIPHMIGQKNGRIINVSSMAGVAGNYGQANYSAAKAGVIAFTKTCAKELGKYAITVNAIGPSHKTRLYEHVPEDVFKKMMEKRSLRRMSDADELSPAFIFLASDEASYITGQVLGVDGGLSL